MKENQIKVSSKTDVHLYKSNNEEKSVINAKPFNIIIIRLLIIRYLIYFV